MLRRCIVLNYNSLLSSSSSSSSVSSTTTTTRYRSNSKNNNNNNNVYLSRQSSSSFSSLPLVLSYIDRNFIGRSYCTSSSSTILKQDEHLTTTPFIKFYKPSDTSSSSSSNQPINPSKYPFINDRQIIPSTKSSNNNKSTSVASFYREHKKKQAEIKVETAQAPDHIHYDTKTTYLSSDLPTFKAFEEKYLQQQQDEQKILNESLLLEELNDELIFSDIQSTYTLFKWLLMNDKVTTALVNATIRKLTDFFDTRHRQSTRLMLSFASQLGDLQHLDAYAVAALLEYVGHVDCQPQDITVSTAVESDGRRGRVTHSLWLGHDDPALQRTQQHGDGRILPESG
ncbi:hypothetical protein DFA_07726 [Cavenderia fasciculata]|uniref:Uncharacterized protein n=1 Tax=Cavenderia fasciculata TaxID=261658 RepID=F4Q326_CACFS|nr:uncharacterized protein DFA_07726 [Cavenderia fasciculata]EGG16748.1 hypothetical protein DFA_07726 [Cavenderia fasciculata]|eukprot:XP_004355222.1 hypothetical protein DFA_07726 [Cavenderia fasciculata]